MARQRFDIGSKWLLHNQGRGALLVGGLRDVRSCEPMPGELAQNRRYPDGLLQAIVGNDPKPLHVLIEIATSPEKRSLEQAMDDLTLAYSALGHLPELLMLVLRPKGKFRIGGTRSIQSKLGLSRLEVEWRTIELWTLSAEEFLAQGDVGILPWVPLMQMDGPPESVLERCAERIERESPPKQRTDMLVISEVMAGLRFPGLDLMTLFGGKKMMIESPLIQKVIAETIQDSVLDVLKDRFETVPRDVTKLVRAEMNDKKLKKLVVLAGKCRDLDKFRDALSV
jgi:hypothetical protein